MNFQTSRDAEGYLINPDDWNEDIAIELANEEGIELDDTYWSVLNFMRKYYSEHNVTPDVRHLIKHMATENQCEKKQAKKLVFELFPYDGPGWGGAFGSDEYGLDRLRASPGSQ